MVEPQRILHKRTGSLGSIPAHQNSAFSSTESKMGRRYGFFRCSDCGAKWESSHVYSKGSEKNNWYSQECKKCRTSHQPYRTEPIRCRDCGQHECVCTQEDKDKRHVDPNKPHRRDLCQKCKSGRPCGGRY